MEGQVTLGSPSNKDEKPVVRLQPLDPEVKPETGILDLPAEIRQAIISEVVFHARAVPALTEFTPENRRRLRNRFNPQDPGETNIYVQRGRHTVLNGGALLETNRLLRQDTIQVMNLFKAQANKKMAEPLFKLDVMVVKDVGLFPTWLSFPYLPKQIDQLEIDFRIVRPPKDISPEWVDAAQYLDSYRHDLSDWNFQVLLSMYATSQLSSSSRFSEEAVTACSADETSEGNVLDAYTSAVAPYTVDKMIIECQPLEYWPNGQVISPSHEDDWEHNYRKGQVPFARVIFEEPPIFEAAGQFKPSQSTVDAAKVASSNLCGGLHRILGRLQLPMIGKYRDVIARSVRTVTLKDMDGGHWAVMGASVAEGRHGNWMRLFVGECGWVFDDVASELAEQEGRADRNEFRVEALRTVARRMELGWWDHKEYKDYRVEFLRALEG